MPAFRACTSTRAPSAREAGDLPRLWLRGGFPPAYLALSDADGMVWRKAYVTTFLERDVPALAHHHHTGESHHLSTRSG